MQWHHILNKKHIELENIVNVGDYVYRLDNVVSDEFKVTKLQVIDIKQDTKESSEEHGFTVFYFIDKILTLSDNSTYKMSNLIYKPNIYEEMHIYCPYNKKWPNTKIFLTKELAYNYLYWESYNKAEKYKANLLAASRLFNIWNNKEKVYKKYKDIQLEKRFKDYEDRNFKK